MRPKHGSPAAWLAAALLVGAILRPPHAQATSAACTGAWTIVPSQNGGSGSGLNSVSALSPTDVWAVGQSRFQPLIEHWDGRRWAVVPNPTVSIGTLFGVSALSGNDVWAVGYDRNGQGTDQTLTEHWDGTSWIIVASPNVGENEFNLLEDVSARSSNDVWAVGEAGSERTLTEHWDGTSWTIIPSRNVKSGPNVLHAVSAVSANDVLAGGEYVSNANYWTPLIEQWGGSGWKIIPSPILGYTLRGISGLSQSDAWAVGGSPQFSEHWDGTTWSSVPLPATTGGFLSAVSARSSGDVWAVGEYFPTPNVQQTLIDHWDGTSWSEVSSPNVTDTNGLLSVSADAATDAWAVGTWYDVNYRSGTLIEHFC
jgi:hypothetical protein